MPGRHGNGEGRRDQAGSQRRKEPQDDAFSAISAFSGLPKPGSSSSPADGPSSSSLSSLPSLALTPVTTATIPPGNHCLPAPTPSALLPRPLPSCVPPPSCAGLPGWASRGSATTRSTPSSPTVVPVPSLVHVPHRRRGSGTCAVSAAAVFDAGIRPPSQADCHLQPSRPSSSSLQLDPTNASATSVANASLSFAIATAKPTIAPATATTTVPATPPPSVPTANCPSSSSDFATIAQSALGQFWPAPGVGATTQPAIGDQSLIAGGAVSTTLKTLADFASVPQPTDIPPPASTAVAPSTDSTLLTIKSLPPSPRTLTSRPPQPAPAAGPRKWEPQSRPDAVIPMPGGRPLAPDGGTSSSSASSTPNFKRPAVDIISEDGSIPQSRVGPGGKAKLPRLDRGGDDFSSVVKNRLQSYTRTGQACDRCKVRKIRCDALPEGCSHCINLNLDCYVTDRVTGRTERRGYMQQLEREKNGMLTHIRDLEHMLWDKGIEVRPYSSRTSDDLTPKSKTKHEDSWTQVRSLSVKQHSENADTVRFLLPNFPRTHLESRPETVSLGGGLDGRPYGIVNGTRLQIMGATIDTASFEAPDLDEPPLDSDGSAPIYNKSVQAFLRSIMGKQPPMGSGLPGRDDAFTYTNWFFLILAAYIPILHKPTFMRTLHRIYDEPSFKPTVPELVQVHMVFATIFYQWGIRNQEDAKQRDNLNNLSNKHYHFSLSKFYELLSSDDLSAMQALTLITSHTRSFPKPGCGTMVANMVFQRAIELNYHRSPEIPASGTNRNIELRKRVWWVLLGGVVCVTGRRGRPMPISVEEFDVGVPEPYNDDALLEDGIDKSKINGSCEWEVGRTTFKIVPIMMEMYSNLYSVRRDTHNYKRIVYALEAELDKLEEEMPTCVKIDSANQEHYVGALYIKMYVQETRLWLRHNSVNPISDKRMMVENSKICEANARELLKTVQKIIEHKSLDTTWTQMSIYAMSLFSMLVAGWERRFETTPEQLVSLRKDMDDWLVVLKELSRMMGAGPGIRDAINGVIVRTMQWIENDMPNNQTQTAPPTPASNDTPAQVSAPPPTAIKKEPLADHAANNNTLEPQPAMVELPSQASTLRPVPEPQGHSPAQAMPQQHQHDGAYYGSHGLNGHDSYTTLPYNGQHENNAGPPAYGSEAGIYYANQSQEPTTPLPGSGHGVQHNPLMSFASHATHQVDPAEQLMWQRSGVNAWQEWTAAIADSQDRYGAGALLTLGSAATAGAPPVPRTPIGVMENGQSTPHEMTAQWPLVMFDPHAPPHFSNEQHEHPL